MRLLDRFMAAGRGWSAPEKIGFRDLTEVPRPSLLPWLDRPGLHDRTLTPHQRAWRRDGVVIMPKMLSDEEIDPYVAVRSKLGLQGGWHSPTPYLHVPELRSLALAPKLMRILRDLLGEDMMLHLCLTGWVSTERDWHQDDYLNPGHVNSYYAAVWIALDDIAAESGPFEYIPGSHRWRLMRQARVRRFLTPEEEASRDPRTGAEFWPKLSERFVVPAIAREIARRKIAPVQFLGRRGDVLIWHSRLMHRGSRARVPGAVRKSLICHYSGVHHRDDMARRAQDENGMWYAVFDHELQ